MIPDYKCIFLNYVYLTATVWSGFFNLIYLYINSILHQNILYLKHTCSKLHKETRTPWHNIPFTVTCILINIIHHTVWTFTYFRHFIPFVDIVYNVSKMFTLLKFSLNNIRFICKTIWRDNWCNYLFILCNI